MCQLSRLQRTVALGLAYSVVQRQKMTLAATAAWGNLSLQRPTSLVWDIIDRWRKRGDVPAR